MKKVLLSAVIAAVLVLAGASQFAKANSLSIAINSSPLVQARTLSEFSATFSDVLPASSSLFVGVSGVDMSGISAIEFKQGNSWIYAPTVNQNGLLTASVPTSALMNNQLGFKIYFNAASNPLVSVWANSDAGVAIVSSSAPVTVNTGDLSSPDYRGSAVLGATTGYQFHTVLQYGNRGAEVTELQARLQAEGLFRVKPTGYFGTITRASVRAFQKAHGLPQSGKVDAATQDALNA